MRFARSGTTLALVGLRASEAPVYRTAFRLRRMPILLEVGPYVEGGGWYARALLIGRDHRTLTTYAERLAEAFGDRGACGIRGFGRTREDAVRGWRQAAKDGSLWRRVSGPAPIQFDQRSEYDI